MTDKTPKQLLFVTSYSELGGGETALLTLAGQLDPARYRPHLLAPRRGALSQRWKERGWPLHTTPWRGANVNFIPALWALLPAVKRANRIMRDNDIALVHSEYHSLPMTLPAARRAGIPHVWTCMGWWFRPKIWQRRFFRRNQAAFAHSKAIKNGFLGEPPFMPPDELQLLYPGVDTNRFHPEIDGIRVRFAANIPQDAPLVALIARFQDVKGHDVFQAMAQQVALQIPQAHFIVAGENIDAGQPGDLYKQKILLIAERDPLLRNRVRFLGFRADVERVIAAADVVVCSSHFEGYGMVNVEAMACGKPVVSTNRGGPAETIAHGETGYLVEPGDAAGLARYVIELLRDPDRRARMGAAGRARVEQHFSAEQMGAVFTRVVEGLL